MNRSMLFECCSSGANTSTDRFSNHELSPLHNPYGGCDYQGVDVGWAGSVLAPLLVPRARILLVAMALGLAALELIIIRPRRKPEEPTESLGAFAIVLVAQQLTDAARLLVFVMAASSAVPHLASAGGMLGSAVTVAVGWLAGPGLARLPLVGIRRALGVILAAAAIWLVL